MKMKPTEQEKYFARKNQRHEWWQKNSEWFYLIPMIVVVVLALLWLLSNLAFKIGFETQKYQVLEELHELQKPQP